MKIFQSWIPFWISSNYGYEQTTMIRLSFGIVTLVVIAIQLGFEKCSMLILWYANRIENLIDLQQIGRNRFETDQVCLLVNNFKNEYHSDRYLGKSREWVFDRDQWTARTSFLIFKAQSSVCLDAPLHGFHCWCIDCKCLGKIKNWQNGETNFSSLIHTTQKDFQIDSRALIGWD